MRSAATAAENSQLSRTTTSGPHSSMVASVPGSAARAWQAAKISRMT